MKNFIPIALFLLISIYSSNASLFGFGFGTSCPSVPAIADFSKENYVGKWYEIERIPMIFEKNLDCVTAEYGINSNGRISVKNSGTNLQSNVTSVTTGEAYVADVNAPNKLIVEFPQNVLAFKFVSKGDYQVWKTDYKNYALVYSCKIYLGFIKFEASWILSRNKDLNLNNINELKNLLSSNSVNPNSFEKVKQTCSN